MMTKKEFEEYVMSDHMPNEHLPDGSVCFENIHVFWFKTSEKLPEPNRKCYGAYLIKKPTILEKDSDETFTIVKDNVRFNNKTNKWEWLFEAGFDYWQDYFIPDYWAYKDLPMGPSI